jgi:hypothetical protein
MDTTFVLQSGSTQVSAHMACVRSIMDLMVRQNIPVTAESLRGLNDTALLRLGMLSAVAGVSTWKRDAPMGVLFQLSEDGRLIHPYTPNAVETDVMLCVVCALLVVIAMSHLQPKP